MSRRVFEDVTTFNMVNQEGASGRQTFPFKTGDIGCFSSSAVAVLIATTVFINTVIDRQERGLIRRMTVYNVCFCGVRADFTNTAYTLTRYLGSTFSTM